MQNDQSPTENCRDECEDGISTWGFLNIRDYPVAILIMVFGVAVTIFLNGDLRGSTYIDRATFYIAELLLVLVGLVAFMIHVLITKFNSLIGDLNRKLNHPTPCSDSKSASPDDA